MDSGFDEGDFKKARGMLLSFSSILIGLWFFGADLRSVSVFGTTVAFTQNTEHVWLIAMALNGYFLLRFYQQSEAVPYATNSEYRVSFPRFLVSSTRIIHRKALKQMFQEQMSHMSLPTTPFRWEVVNAGSCSTVGHESIPLASESLVDVQPLNARAFKLITLSLYIATELAAL
jgi:hypothetical protein